MVAKHSQLKNREAELGPIVLNAETGTAHPSLRVVLKLNYEPRCTECSADFWTQLASAGLAENRDFV